MAPAMQQEPDGLGDSYSHACLFVLVLVALIYAAFSTVAGPWMRFAFATIDGLLGYSIHHIVRYLLFLPSKKASCSFAIP